LFGLAKPQEELIVLEFPIDIKSATSGGYTATWVDFPDLPTGSGSDKRAAFENLMAISFDIVGQFVAAGQFSDPSPAEGRPTVSFADQQALIPKHLGRLLAITPHGNLMVTHSWTNSASYVE
jgi:hypothetical protein